MSLLSGTGSRGEAMNAIVLRTATRLDVPVMHAMLVQSAVAQGGEAELCISPADLMEDGFSSNPRFQCLIAECDGHIAGLALYFFIYSTWTSRNGLYLEDLYVAPQFRRHGVARALMAELAAIAQHAGCRYMRWLVLRRNASAIRFYESIGAPVVEEAGMVQVSLH